ncbi:MULTISPECIES: 16S rRNA (guanine(966)-N(2))-methyltransferase RsmD [Psychrobacter]|jgi:16S rRNA (guanine966-N2)-methyltransferase|uniref:Ribosomal RNA small subunit methyltransferase D n=1 Tax=Psychrobacter faecalis TaxID=180588 RepID=A0ABT9HIZ7_9GAMM|nr:MULTISPECIES: 16S rRNA (guanine(966)-N(2))-methyltransferase RsmD [Psychrobacter]MBP7942681.1 16S rRNA (guanine(966)-N(2))-methyltransferase RsmD [Psychrobacter sp.]MBP7956399.1 16S rRNA (guanine(966)-N(2))-methyltransferase RsmD [Psychrobacter sp.]MBP8032149.1 16S rRNA (guanine(966)-N(2))-methyltransferase RsmD [Psychrobacter sp.]MBP8816243.1 16S rRNA (guanine(966)-N(2))-methyltransferase RsmD [Psychrobacter sp.]MBP9647452.1 16S rRNA (guanine(966)-N(2))-methyltransferase RsmD [Psychrobacte
MKKLSNGREQKKNHKAKNAVAGDVRIIGGQYKRRIVSFIDAEGLRPTPDRLRETLFNWLIADIHDAKVLDSCAGSGVLGFEALSRGAAHTTFIEVSSAQVTMLRQSAEQLRLDASNYQIIQGTAEQVLTQNQTIQRHFDIVFIDPPYAQDLWQPILTALIKQSLINTETLIYLEADKDLTLQLDQLVASINESAEPLADIAQSLIRFECLKQTKVGQVVAGLYQLSAS